MQLTKKSFHKENGRLGYHIIQSFNGNEVSPKKANQIGQELAKELWGDKYQVLVCTHTNKENVHNHIILNSVSFIDGTKYHNSNLDIAMLRETNDNICIKYGLSIVDTEKSNNLNKVFKNRIANYNRSSGKMELIKTDIDNAIANAKKYQDFVDELNNKCYYIKSTGKYLTITTPYYNRNIRISRCFGEDYTLENIKNRIYQHDLYYKYLKQENNNEKVYVYKVYDKVQIDSNLLKLSSFYRKYVHYLYVLGKLPATIHYEYRTKEYFKEIDKFDKICEEMKMIGKYNFKTTSEVQTQITNLSEKVAPLKSKREELEIAYNRNTNTTEKESIKTEINTLTEDINQINNELKIFRRIIVNTEKGDLEEELIKKRQRENQEKNLNTLNKNLKRELQ